MKVQVREFFARAASFTLRLLLVPKCVCCGEVLEGSGELCPSCLDVWGKALARKCPVCGKTARHCTCMPYSLFGTTMIGEHKMVSLTFFGKPDSTDERDAIVRKLVYALKRSDNRAVVRFAARELSIALLKMMKTEKISPEMWHITYAPRTAGAVRKYGFDQGRDLARLIAKYTGITYDPVLKRCGGRMQKSLNLFQRKDNAKKSYCLKDNAQIHDKYIIVDDVITTGATVDACASLLCAAGAKQVFPICVSKTMKKKRKLRRSPSKSPWFLKI